MLPSIAQHASKHGIKPLKKYGQNFLFDLSLCDKIVRASKLVTNGNVVEVGPGTAGLTRAILALNPNSLTVIETDNRCIALLEEVRSIYPNLHIIHGDALKSDLSNFVRDNAKIDIISNLPYQIGTSLLIKWLLKDIVHINSITVMLQKEVVDRICAKPDNKNYGRLTVICQLICNVQKCFDVSPQAFYPPPTVDSTIVRLEPMKIIPIKKINMVENITRIAFAERRKMIRSSLKSIKNINDHLSILGIDQTCRAENLSPQNYLALADLVGDELF